MRPPSGPTVAQVLADLVTHPVDRLVRRWNWKSAVLSALIRGAIFFTVNLSAGFRAALGAFGAELIFRVCTAGFYGAMTEAFVAARPHWLAMATTMVWLPVMSHTLEYAVHRARGTPELFASIAVSAAFTAVSTSFNLFAMRRGALIVGPGRAPVLHDLRRMPHLIAAFVAAVFRGFR